MHELINDTLVAKGGRVTLTVVQDNAPFKIVRGPATTYQPQITYPNGSTQTVTVKELRSLFPAVVYSQGELAEIGKQAGKKTQLADLLQFVNPDFKHEDDRIRADIEVAKTGVRTAIQTQTAYWLLQAEHRKLIATRESLKERVSALEKTLPTLSDDDKAIVDYFDKANEFDSKRLQASKHADQILRNMATSAAELLSERDLATDLKDDAADVRQKYADLFKTFFDGVAKLQADLKTKRDALTTAENGWATKFKDARTERDRVLEKLGAHKTVTAQIIKLREEITQLTNQIGDLETKIKAEGDPSVALNAAVDQLKKLNELRGQRTEEWAREIERLSSSKIKAAVSRASDASEIREALDIVAGKTGSQEGTRLKELEAALAANPVWNVLDRLRTDCLALLYWRQIGAASGEEQPKCPDLYKIVGDTERVKTALIEKMDSVRVEAMAVAVPKPEIVLSYTDGKREIAFEKASEGQRAAALLFMLLEQAGGPLIVDQPEGDLDNRIIADLTDKLHTAKQNRQLIFASHNANIVVNGSAELVGHLDEKDTGERQFDGAGAIDHPDICKVITATMEGGEKAFKDRQNKYGY